MALHASHRRAAPRRVLSILAMCAALLAACSESRAADGRPAALDIPLRPGKADAFFQSGEIPLLRLEIPTPAMDRLRRNPRGAVKALVREGTNVYPDVAVHLKGAAGSFRGVDDRPALTLNFDKFRQGQRFQGLDKLHLNNSVQDPSYLTELVCGELFMAAGVPAARTTHAIVELNGRKLGLYVLKEGFNKTLLKRFFKDPEGDLYDGGFLRDIDQTLEKISGPERDGQPAVEALVQACQIPDPEVRRGMLEKTLDLDRFLSLMALEMMTWHWDGYYMKRNNYRVYHDVESHRVVFLPHGMDQMFWDTRGSVQPGAEGMVAAAVLQVPSLKARYRARAAWLSTNIFRSDRLSARVEELGRRVGRRLADVEPEQAHDHAEAVKRLARLVQLRAEYLERVLTMEPPKPLVLGVGESRPLKGWKSKTDSGQPRFREWKEAGQPLLQVEAVPAPRLNDTDPSISCLASYRIPLILPPGRYFFSGRVRAEGIVPVSKSVRGSGAGLRISGRKRTAGLVGDQDWTELRYEFSVADSEEEVELICDLRALSGRAVFDVGSLKLGRLGEEDP